MEEVDLRKAEARRTRKHTQRVRNKRKKYYVAEGRTVRHLGVVLETPTTCSCIMCGNNRNYDGCTMQEKRSAERFNDFIDEFC